MLIKSQKFLLVSAVLTALTLSGFAQTDSLPKPTERSLLNQLKVLIWRQPRAEKIAVSLRIHSGAAFDPLGKEGVACLLVDVMFPDTGIYEDFEENFGGSLNVSCNYDFVQIETNADRDKLVPVLEILAAALENPPIDKETTAEAKKNRIEELQSAERNSTILADLETAERLYGDFPYGRPVSGSIDSVSRIDFADLIFAKQRFLTADNATLSIAGNLESSFAYRAARRVFGGWQKGNGRIPANFTIPSPPDATPLTVNTDHGSGIEERFAIETAARPSSDFYTSKLLYRILHERAKEMGHGSLVHKHFLLRGYYLLRIARPAEEAPREPEVGEGTPGSNPISKMLLKPATETEFAKARSFELAEFSGRGQYQNWFDIYTYGLKSVKEEGAKLSSVSLAEINSYAARLAKNDVVRVVVVPLGSVDPLDDTDPPDPR